MARACGFVSCMLYTAYGCKKSTVSRETNGAARGVRGVCKMFH